VTRFPKTQELYDKLQRAKYVARGGVPQTTVVLTRAQVAILLESLGRTLDHAASVKP
jgi:hypothetical protein